MKNLLKISVFVFVFYLALSVFPLSAALNDKNAIVVFTSNNIDTLLFNEKEDASNQVQQIEINPLLFDTVFPDKIFVNLSNDVNFYAVKDSEETMLGSIRIWYGHVENQVNSSVIFVVDNEKILGDFLISEGHFALKMDENYRPSIMKYPNHDTYNYTEDRYNHPIDRINMEGIASTDNALDESVIEAGGKPTIRVLIGWQSWSVDSWQPTTRTQAAMYIAQTNQALQRSNAQARVTLAESILVHTYPGSSVWHFWDLWNYIQGSILAEARDVYAADLVIVMEHWREDTYCGYYWGEHAAVASDSFCDNGYAVAKYIGLLIGCGIQRPMGQFFYGVYDYSHGYIAPDNSFRTLVTFSNQPLILNFSNPLILEGGIPTGIDENAPDSADNVRTINKRAPGIANIRNKPIIRPIAVINLDPEAGIAPLTVQLDGSESYVPTGEEIISYGWSFGDNPSTATGAVVQQTYSSPGTWAVGLTVTDSKNRTGTSTRYVSVFSPATLSIRVNFEENSIKANAKAQTKMIASIYADNTKITAKMDITLSTNNCSLLDDFYFSAGNYYQTVVSGEPGSGSVTASLGGSVTGTGEIQFTWPQPPANPDLRYETNRSLFIGYHNVYLSWEKNTLDILYPANMYKVYRSKDGGEYQLIAELPPNVFTFEDMKVAAGLTYLYAVAKTDVEGDESVKTVGIEVR